MPAPPSDRFVADRPPRHAAEADPSGRHRRPESLADSPHLRPTAMLPPHAAGRPISRRSPSRAVTDTHPADQDILEARLAAVRLPRPSPAPTTTGRPVPRRHAAPTRGRRAAPPRGRHAKPGDPLAITVRPLNDGLRAAGTWARDGGERPSVIGSHRAPGTLPIESWLLIGKTRQQALLAGLVAAGLLLAVVPGQRNNDVNPVNAADHAAVSAEKSRAAADRAPASAATPPKRATSSAPAPPTGLAPTQGVPATTAPSAQPTTGPTAAAETAETPVPPGAGPARSLTTTGTTAVALTFDDGPDPVQTPKILALLDKYQVKAIFCLVGTQVQKHPEIVRQMVAAGHTLCNHSWDHSLTLGRQPAGHIRTDLERTNAAIRAAVPGAEIPFFRAPGGHFTDRLVQAAYADGMASLYWEVDPRDWDDTLDAADVSHVDKVVADVRKSVRPGSIVLSHDYDQPDTVLAYEKLLPWLTENFDLGLPSVPPPAATRPAQSSAGPPA